MPAPKESFAPSPWLRWGGGRCACTVRSRLLGFVPISIGLVGITKLLRAPKSAGAAGRLSSASGQAVFMATFLSQLGNGADTILTFGVLFADSMPTADVLIVATLAVMAIIFVAVAKYAVQHPRLSDVIERYAHRVTPFVLVAVGAYIIANTATDLLPD